jgi:PST family polysaccharide transporter
MMQRFSPNALKIADNVIWLLAERILRMVLGVLVGVWMARYLQPEQFGLYNYAIAFIALFSAVSTLGLDQIVIRNLIHHPESREKILGTTFALKLFGGGIAFLIAVSMIRVIRPNNPLTQILVSIIALSLIVQSLDVIDFWFQSQVRSKYTAIARNTALILSSIGKVILIQQKAPLLPFALLYSGELALTALGFVLAYHSTGLSIVRWHYSLKYAIALVKESWSLFLSAFVIMIYMRTDQIMLGQMVGDQAVGIYSAAVRVSELWYFVPGAIFGSIYPAIVDAKQIGEAIYYQRLRKSFNLAVMISSGFALVISLLSQSLIDVLFGSAYAEAGAILIVHVWAGVFVTLGMVRSQWTTIEGLMQFAFITTAIGAVINIVLNFLLIPHYSGMGAAIATLIAQLFASYLGGAFFSKTRKIFLIQTQALFMPNVTLLWRGRG